MESQPQNPEFRINPENFHPCVLRLLLPPYYLKQFITLPKKDTCPVGQVNGNLHLPLSNLHTYNTSEQVDVPSSNQF